MDPLTTLLAESAAVAAPVVATLTYAVRGRKRLRVALRQPLFWDGGQPVTLATIHHELNGEGRVEGELRELLGGSGPLELAELEQAVGILQADPAKARRLVLELATEVVLRGTIPRSGAALGVDATVATMDRLASRQDALGFFAFMTSLNAERAPGQPALLPVEALMPGGFPIGPPPDGEPTLNEGGGMGVLGMLQTLGLGNQGDWLPGVMRAVGDLVRDRAVKKARDNYQKSLAVLGRTGGEALRRRTLAGEVVRRNVYSPLDAYRNLATRMNAQPRGRRSAVQVLVPSVALAFHEDFAHALARATAIVQDKCANLERTLVGRSGDAFAGEVLYRHRGSLLAGVDPGAFPLGACELAKEAYRLAREGELPTAAAAPTSIDGAE